MTLHLTEHDRLGLLSGVDQIADFLNCSRQRVERMIETGQLAPVFFSWSHAVRAPRNAPGLASRARRTRQIGWKPQIVIEIAIEPAGRGQYRAFVGDRELGVFRVPLCDVARILKAEGTPDRTPLVLRHAAGAVSLRSTVGRAAALTVREDDRWLHLTRYVPFQMPRESTSGSPKTADRGSAARQVPADPKRPLASALPARGGRG